MADEGAPKSGFRRWRGPIGGAFAVVLIVLVGYWNRHPPGSRPLTGPDTPSVMSVSAPDPNNPTNDPPAPPELTALLGGLKVGSTVAGWRVASMTISSKPEVKGALTVLLKQGQKTFALWITPKGQLKMPAPNETEKHSIYSGFFVNTEWLEVATALEEIVELVRSSEAAPAAAPSAQPQ